jgi:hypothetical protein
MCPATYVLLDRLPLTANGKVDHGALPPPAPATSSGPAYEAPIGDIETVLTDVWSEILAVSRVGRHDNFFDLGGHSLLAVRMVERVHARSGVTIPLAALFEAPTPAALALRLSTARPSEESRSTDDILANQREWVKPWKGHRRSPDSFIVTRNEGARRPGLFWCLQAESELAALAKHLGSFQPVHGMRSGHHVMKYTEQNIRTLASRYAKEMAAIQPSGSFVLGGNCQGGRIAEAIARRLRELGREVALLFLMEQRRFRPYDGRVALIFGRDSLFNPYTGGSDPSSVFRQAYPAGYTVDVISGAHGQFFGSPNVETLAAAIENRIAEVSGTTPARLSGLSRIAARMHPWLDRS